MITKQNDQDQFLDPKSFFNCDDSPNEKKYAKFTQSIRNGFFGSGVYISDDELNSVLNMFDVYMIHIDTHTLIIDTYVDGLMRLVLDIENTIEIDLIDLLRPLFKLDVIKKIVGRIGENILRAWRIPDEEEHKRKIYFDILRSMKTDKSASIYVQISKKEEPYNYANAYNIPREYFENNTNTVRENLELSRKFTITLNMLDEYRLGSDLISMPDVVKYATEESYRLKKYETIYRSLLSLEKTHSNPYIADVRQHPDYKRNLREAFKVYTVIGHAEREAYIRSHKNNKSYTAVRGEIIFPFTISELSKNKNSIQSMTSLDGRYFSLRSPVSYYKNYTNLDIFRIAELHAYTAIKHGITQMETHNMMTIYNIHKKYAFRSIDYAVKMYSDPMMKTLRYSYTSDPSKRTSRNTECFHHYKMFPEEEYRYRRIIVKRNNKGKDICDFVYDMVSKFPKRWLYKGMYRAISAFILNERQTFVKTENNSYPSIKAAKWIKRAMSYDSCFKKLIEMEVLTNTKVKHKIERDEAWMECFGKYPKNGWVRDIDAAHIRYLKSSGNFKYFIKYINKYKNELSRDSSHSISSLVKLCAFHGNKISEYIKENTTLKGIHDIGVNYPMIHLSQHEASWFYKQSSNKKNKVSDLLIVLSRYKSTGLSLKQPTAKLVEICRYMVYDNVQSLVFANECARHSVGTYSYEDYEEGYLDFKTYESLPQILFEDGDYKFFKLDYDDPRGLFLGEYTDCCQHIEGYGHECAWYGHNSGESAFYVVTKKDKIVAQSWAWRNGDIVVLDSVECLDDSSSKRYDRMRNMFEKASHMMLGKLGITQVNTGCNSGVFEDHTDEYENTDSVPAPTVDGESIYTDSSRMVVLAKLEK